MLEGLLEQSGGPAYGYVALAPLPLDRVPRLIEGPAAVASLIVESGLAERVDA